MKTFFRFYKLILSLLKDLWLNRIIAQIAVILLIFLESYIVIILGQIIDDLSSGDIDLSNKLVKIVIYISIPFVIEPIAYYMKDYQTLLAQKRIVSGIYHKIINQDYKFHIDKQTGKLITKILRSSDLVNIIFWDLEHFLFTSILQFFIPLVLIYQISPKLFLAAAISFLATLPFIAIAVNLNLKYRAFSKDIEYERNNTIADGITNFTAVRAFGKEQREEDLLDERLKEYRKSETKYKNTWRFVDFVSRLSGLIVFGSVSYILVKLYDTKSITIGEVIIVVTYMNLYVTKVIGLFFSIRNAMRDIPMMQDILDIFESNETVIESKSPRTIGHAQGEITLENVHFTYTNKTQVIEGISLVIKPKQTVAFVGPSGGGKTTLTKLIMRYYDPTDGQIKIDGVNIKDLSYETLRSLIGLVPQEPVLFNKSIYYNVAYAFEDDFQNKDKNFGLVVEACKKAQIHDFIESLPEGYDTIVGERGLKLSGGQKQRIAIAQVIIKNPKIVIFDEATSQLDSESEKAIQTAFAELSHDKTVIIIAHRLSTITHADNIFVINQGHVKETGRHKDLLKINNGIYAGLWDIQSGGFRKQKKIGG